MFTKKEMREARKMVERLESLMMKTRNDTLESKQVRYQLEERLSLEAANIKARLYVAEESFEMSRLASCLMLMCESRRQRQYTAQDWDAEFHKHVEGIRSATRKIFPDVPEACTRFEEEMRGFESKIREPNSESVQPKEKGTRVAARNKPSAETMSEGQKGDDLDLADTVFALTIQDD